MIGVGGTRNHCSYLDAIAGDDFVIRGDPEIESEFIALDGRAGSYVLLAKGLWRLQCEPVNVSDCASLYSKSRGAPQKTNFRRGVFGLAQKMRSL